MIELDAMYAPQKDSPVTALAGAVDTSTTSMYFQTIEFLPLELIPFPLTLGIDQNVTETVLVTAADTSSNMLTVERALYGDAAEWVAGTKCARTMNAADMEALQANVRHIAETADGTASELPRKLNTTFLAESSGSNDSEALFTEVVTYATLHRLTGNTNGLKVWYVNPQTGVRGSRQFSADSFAASSSFAGFMTQSQVVQLTNVRSGLTTETARAQAAEAALIPRAIAAALVTGGSVSVSASGVTITLPHVSPVDGTTGQTAIALPLASESNPGMIPKEAYTQIGQNTSDIESLRNMGGRRIGTFDTPAQLDAYVWAAEDKAGDWANVRVDSSQNNAATRYYAVDDGDGGLAWQFDMPYSSGATPYATQETAGISKGVNAYGKIYYEDDHTASWVGATEVREELDNLQSAQTTAAQQIALKANKTDVYTKAQTDAKITAAYTAPTTGPLAGMSLTNAIAYINQLLGGTHKDITLDVNSIKVVTP